MPARKKCPLSLKCLTALRYLVSEYAVCIAGKDFF